MMTKPKVCLVILSSEMMILLKKSNLNFRSFRISIRGKQNELRGMILPLSIIYWILITGSNKKYQQANMKGMLSMLLKNSPGFRLTRKIRKLEVLLPRIII